MATQAQIDANRLNAQKSTGPKTEAGKAKACLNRTSHGFTGALRCLPHEDPAEFDALLSDLLQQFQPANSYEQILVEKMAHNQWLSLRAIRLQSDTLCLGARIRTTPADFALFLRYQASAERNFHRAHAELLKAQKQRDNSEIGFESQTAEAAPQPQPEPESQPSEATQKPPATTPKPATEPPNVPEIGPQFIPAGLKFAEDWNAELVRAA